jgi:hypothetical protein
MASRSALRVTTSVSTLRVVTANVAEASNRMNERARGAHALPSKYTSPVPTPVATVAVNDTAIHPMRAACVLSADRSVQEPLSPMSRDQPRLRDLQNPRPWRRRIANDPDIWGDCAQTTYAVRTQPKVGRIIRT